MNKTNTSLTSAALSQERDDVPYLLIIISSMTVAFGVISFGIMMKAPRIASNIRYMCSNIIFYDICVVITYASHYSLLDYPRWFYYRATQYSVLGQWFAVTGFSVERLLAIDSPFQYCRYCKKAYVKAFVSVELFCYTTILICTSFVDREPKRAMRVCWGAISLHTTFSTISLVCSLKTLFIFKRSFSQSRPVPLGVSNTIKKLSRSRGTISVFCILFVVLHIPIGIETITRRCEFNPNERLYTSYLIIINSAIDPLLYVWKFRECRLQGLTYLSQFPCFGFLKSTVEMRRIDIFNIPIAERSISRRQNANIEQTLQPKPSLQNA